MAKVMLPREEFLRRQGLLEDEKKCCSGVPKLLWIAIIFATIAAGISFLSNKDHK